MDYEKKYKEALERAKSFQEKYGGDYAGYIFPELAESEDERIRQGLIKFVKATTNEKVMTLSGIGKDMLLAWLEKQKESEVSEELDEAAEEYKQGEIDTHVDYHDETGEPLCFMASLKLAFKAGATWQKEQKPVDPSNDELEKHHRELIDFKTFAAKQAKEHHISFVHDFEWNNFCGELLSYFNEHKYVHKDALLEWIEGKMTVEEETEGYIGGYDAALKEVIDKINSM